MSILLPLLMSLSMSAQKVGVKIDDAAASSEETTITVKKGANAEVKYEISEGTDELQGDPAPLQKEARQTWKKSCDEWKKELKELNKDNQILSMTCGTPSCTTSSMETVCKSTTKHKIKVRIN